MILRHRFATFSLLLFSASFLFRPLQATGERAAGRPLAESLTASNSARLRQAAQPGQTPSPQPPRARPARCFLSRSAENGAI